MQDPALEAVKDAIEHMVNGWYAATPVYRPSSQMIISRLELLLEEMDELNS